MGRHDSALRSLQDGDLVDGFYGYAAEDAEPNSELLARTDDTEWAHRVIAAVRHQKHRRTGEA